MHATLDDAEDGLTLGAVLAMPSEAAVEPAVRALGRARRVVAVGVEGGALVEDERDVGAERRLHLHRHLRRDEQRRPVAVGAEPNPLLADRDDRAVVTALAAASLHLVRHSPVRQGEDLEATRVGDQRALPAHEAVQPAGGRDPLGARRDEQVVGVAEDQLVAQPGHLARLEPAHGPFRRQRDEGRRADRSVRGVQHTSTSRAVPRLDLELQSLRRPSHLR